MSWSPNEEEKVGGLIPWKARPFQNTAQTEPKEVKLKSQRGFIETIKKLWDTIKGYTAEDVSRLREAGVQQVEGTARTKMAESEEKIAAAAKAHAEAEKYKAEARAIESNNDINLILARAEAFERVTDAIARIRQAGGDVAFDQSEIKRILNLEDRVEKPDTKSDHLQ